MQLCTHNRSPKYLVSLKCHISCSSSFSDGTESRNKWHCRTFFAYFAFLELICSCLLPRNIENMDRHNGYDTLLAIGGSRIAHWVKGGRHPDQGTATWTAKPYHVGAKSYRGEPMLASLRGERKRHFQGGRGHQPFSGCKGRSLGEGPCTPWTRL